MADETRDLLKQVSADLSRVNDEFSKKSEEALKEVKNLGKLTDETKAEVDKMATAQATLTGTVEELSARLGDVEQKGARRGGEGDKPQSWGAQAAASEKLKTFAASVEGGKRLSVPI